MTAERIRHARRIAGLIPVVGILVASLGLCACSKDPHDDDKPKTTWTVTNMSEDLHASIVVYDKTGVEYISMFSDEDGNQAKGLCERYNSDGSLMHDGDSTKGGAFELEFVEEASDESGETKVYRDSQTGVAYMWHEWQSKQGYTSSGLVPCRSRDGRIQRWDDHMFISVPADMADNDDVDVTTETGNKGTDKMSDDTKDK